MKKLIILCLSILLIPKVNALELAKNAKSAIMLENETGTIIYKKNENERLYPASMTKIMSMILIMEAIDQNQIKWNQKITVSENASKMGGSQILLENGEKMSVKDLFKGISIASANDAVVALAEEVGGTEENFIDMMNEKAKQLNLKNTYFKSPHGLDIEGQYSSAKDMSIMARNLLKHKDILKFTSTYDDYLRKNTKRKLWLVNTNRLVKFYQGLDGLKTGYTKKAGYCLTSTARRNNMRLITVVMGEDTIQNRSKDTTEMLDYAFRTYKLKRINNFNHVKIGKKRLKVKLEKDPVILAKKTDKTKLKAKIKLKELNKIKKNQKIGYLYIIDKNKVKRKINILADQDFKKDTFLDIYFKNIKNALTN